MSATCPAGPPKLKRPILAQTLVASRNEIRDAPEFAVASISSAFRLRAPSSTRRMLPSRGGERANARARSCMLHAVTTPPSPASPERDRRLLTAAGFVRATTTSVVGITLGVHL